MQEDTFALLVERVTPQTPRVKTLRLRPERGDLPFRFVAGQHMGVRPCPAGRRADFPPERWRHFSLSSSAEIHTYAEITVLDQGKLSHDLHHLLPEDAVEVTRPSGRFTLEEPVHRGPVFFGAGIGAAPIRSMIRTCLDRGWGDAVTLFLRFSSPQESLFLEDFRAWARHAPRFRFWTHFSRTGPDGQGPPEPDPFSDPGWFRMRIQDPSERTCYLCLPRGLRDEVHTLLLRLGVPQERIRTESW